MQDQETNTRYYAGERVRGKYFEHPFTGKVYNVSTIGVETFVCVAVDIPFEFNLKTREFVTIALPTDQEEGHSVVEFVEY